MHVIPPSSLRSAFGLAGRLFAATCLGSLLCLPTSVRSGVHVCTLPDGGRQYQDRPCTASAPTAAVAPGAPGAARPDRPSGRSRAAAGIEPGWLARPQRAPYRAFCDRRGCECGSLERVFADLRVAVADALYIDGAWLRYEQSVSALDNASSSADSVNARAELNEAACELAMSQRTLELFLEPTLERLLIEASDPRASTGRSANDCAGVDCPAVRAERLYRRMLQDRDMLLGPRGGSATLK